MIRNWLAFSAPNLIDGTEKRLADAADVAKRGSGQYQVRIPISRFAALAQLVEHLIRNEGVVGSNPIGGTTPLSISRTA